MSFANPVTPSRRLALTITALSAVAVTACFAIVRGGPVEAAATVVPLGTASSFAVLAGSGITNTGPTVINGDIGTFPTTDITGDSDITLTGTNHAGDDVTKGAKSDLVTAYNDAAAALPPTAVPEELGRIAPYGPGIYKASSSLGLTGAMTLDAGGDPSAVFIFQAPSSTLTTASNSSVVLINGAQACNIFWQVGSSATIGTGTTFRGNILALTSISANTNATFEGRLLASNGAVTLQSNTITKPGCETTPSATTPTATTPTETTPTETTPTETTPTETTPTETTPTETTPTETTPTETTPTETTPTETTPTETTPTETTPTETTPTETTPTETTPTETTPTETTPTETTPTETTPTETTPTETTPTETASAVPVGSSGGGDIGSNESVGNSSDTETSGQLPDTGGPNPFSLPAALIAILGGSVLLLRRPQRGTHRG